MKRKLNNISKCRENKVNRAKTYIRNLSKYNLSDQECLVLSKNLKFVPTPEPPTTGTIMKDINNFAQKMRTRLWIHEHNITPRSERFTSKRNRPDKLSSSNSLENYITATKIEVANIHDNKKRSRHEKIQNALKNINNNRKFKRKNTSNFSKNMHSTLRKLKNNKNIIIKKSDKGNTTTVIGREQYISEGMRQLDSSAHYAEIDTDETAKISREVDDTLRQMLSNNEISKKTYEYLSPMHFETKTAEMYLLNKIHSDPPTKARPIISANNCPVERISEYVDYFLQPFVLQQTTYLKDTSDLIRKIEKIKIPDNALIITLDYESMYTNIVHNEAVDAIKRTIQNSDKYRTVNGIKRPHTDSFCKLLELAIARNTFKFNDKNFYQSRGVAMGHIASPNICDIVIYYLEKQMLKLANNKVLCWLRFRDDVICIYTGTEAEAIYFLDTANKIHSTLKYKYEISSSQGIFLDTIIFKGHRFQTENILDFKPYVKPSESFQYIHRSSSHPKAVFTGLIKGELIRFVRTSTNRCDYLQRATLFKEKLLLRGYMESEFINAFAQVEHDKRQLYLNNEKIKDKIFPLVCVTTYNPHVDNLQKSLLHHWDIIENNQTLKQIFPSRPMIAYKRGENLKDSLVRAKLSTQDDKLESLIQILKADVDSGI